jgi:hypothetical protein
MLLLQNATITEQNMRVNILETRGLAKPEDLIMNKIVLNSLEFFNVIYDSPTSVNAGLAARMLCATSNTACLVVPLGRMEV